MIVRYFDLYSGWPPIDIMAVSSEAHCTYVIQIQYMPYLSALKQISASVKINIYNKSSK